MFRRRPKERGKKFSVNGAAVLEQIIRNFNGDCNPIHSYSVEELKIATNNFQLEMYRNGDYIMYQGTHQNRQIAVKKFKQAYYIAKAIRVDIAAKDIAIASRMSNNKNVLKLLGCCLETELLILVYEFPENGNLGNRLFDRQEQDKLSWDQKLTIVIKIANSIAYLHHGLPNTFIHRNIKSANILLDRDLCPKLFDFQLALQIPEGKTHIDADLAGTLGYLDPEALQTARFTDKSDVYGFGALLCEVLTEKRFLDLFMLYINEASKPLDDSEITFHDFVSKTVKCCGDYLEDERTRVQVIEYAKLMQRCLRPKQEDRPDMIEAEKELRRIKNL